MTDAEKIRKLAEWMGYSQTGMNGYWMNIIPAPDGKAIQTLPPTWNPLERIQDAWMLVDQFASKDIDMQLTPYEGDWRCILYAHGSITILADVGAETAPRAISEAVLRLMEVTK